MAEQHRYRLRRRAAAAGGHLPLEHRRHADRLDRLRNRRPYRILWGGPAHGITGIHEWTFTPDCAQTLVQTAESWDGHAVRADPDNLREALDESLVSWLDHLRVTAENPTA